MSAGFDAVDEVPSFEAAEGDECGVSVDAGVEGDGSDAGGETGSAVFGCGAGERFSDTPVGGATFSGPVVLVEFPTPAVHPVERVLLCEHRRVGCSGRGGRCWFVERVQVVWFVGGVVAGGGHRGRL
jgi:hypothetical protein